jgi:hypothetical protein
MNATRRVSHNHHLAFLQNVSGFQMPRFRFDHGVSTPLLLAFPVMCRVMCERPIRALSFRCGTTNRRCPIQITNIQEAVCISGPELLDMAM